MTDIETIQVTGDNPYDILVGRGIILDHILEHVGDDVRKILIAHAPTIPGLAAQLRDYLLKYLPGREVYLAELPDAEPGKRVEVAAFCWKILGQQDFSRTDLVIGFGGGATTDLAGFAAACWMRGIQVVQIPTTVLAMADAAIGGKTGVNTSEGKNLVGAFWPPAAVLVDLDMLETLPVNERVAGFAEVVKAGFIRYPEILDIIEADPDKAVDPSTPEFLRCMELAIRMKADVVSEDLREAGPREMLNYGHTLGHALEHNERYQWRHGAAVSVGMMYAAELSRLAGRLSSDAVARHRRVLDLLGLPTTYRARAWDGLLKTMQLDKKVRHGMLRFVVLDDIGMPSILQAPDMSLLFAAYQEIAS